MKWFTVGGNQRRAKFVQELESGLVTRDSELLLKLKCRDAGRQGGNEVGGMKPERERELASMHARAGRQTDLMPVPALGYTPSGKRVTGAGPAPRTDETRRPAQVVKILRALLFRGEESLKFQQRPWPLLFGEWVQRLHVVGQCRRIAVRNFVVAHGYLRNGDMTGHRSTLLVVSS